MTDTAERKPHRDVMDITEAADLFRVTPKTIRNWMTKYEDFPKPKRPGGMTGRMLFYRAQLMGWLKKQDGERDEE